MMSAETGCSAKVAGSSIAIVATGPMPGRTPISVPRRQPIRQYIRFDHVRAMPKPIIRFWITSMELSSGAADGERLQRVDVRTERDGKLQARDEHQGAEDDEADGQGERLLEPEAVAPEPGADDEDHSRDQHPQGLQEDAEEADR